MSDPVRWRDRASSASSRASKLFAAGEAPRPMSSVERAAMMRTAAHLARGASIAAASAPALWKAVVAGVVCGGTLLTAAAVVVPRLVSIHRSAASSALPRGGHAAPPTAAMRSTSASSPSPVAPSFAPSPGVTPSSAILPGARSEPVVERASARPAAQATTHARSLAPTALSTIGPPEALDPLQREYALLARAMTDLDANPTAALADLAVHAAQFPSGQLASERECIAIDALNRLDRRAEAADRARRVVSDFPSSPCARRMRHRTDVETSRTPEEQSP